MPDLPTSRFHGRPIIAPALYAWYGDLEDFIRATYDKPDYRLLDTLHEVHNDSMVDFKVPNSLNGDEEDITVEEWLRGETKLTSWGYTQTVPELWDILDDLHERGLIPAGHYCISVSW